MKNETKLQLFLYLLMRDHLPFGFVNRILKDMEELDGKESLKFSNTWNADYAKYIAKILLN